MSKLDSSFWELAKGEHKRARAYCSRLAGSIDEGDDLYQDSLIVAFDAFEQLRDEKAFRSWLYAIINNAFRARFRRPWWKRILASNDELENLGGSMDLTNEYDARRRIEFALAALGTEDRIIVTLAELEGWKISEIAQLQSKTEGQIKMRLSRAREKMRKQLSKMFQGTEQLKFTRESRCL